MSAEVYDFYRGMRLLRHPDVVLTAKRRLRSRTEEARLEMIRRRELADKSVPDVA